ncbi:MAG: tRNA pseudouridine55 synthase [Saprospiraceae bacterium]
MGRRSKTRGTIVNGILLLDKPTGRTSNHALQAVKRLLDARKAGHTGSLDPLATGLLPLCFGQATKVSSYLLGADKRYLVTIKLGVTTTTGDADGEVLDVKPLGFDETQLHDAIEQYIGPQEQMPPMYSALKVNGTPLYKLARQGITIERKRRSVIAHDIQLLSLEGEELLLDVHCSSGYYIRSLTEDIGAALNCGGHVQALRRTHAGDLSLSNAISLEQLEAMESPEQRQQLLWPSDAAVKALPTVHLSEDAMFYLLRGQAVRAPQLPSQGEVRIYGPEEVFLGLGEVKDLSYVAPKKLMVDMPDEQVPLASTIDQ